MFEVDARIESSSLLVAELPLCQVRLMNQADLPWLVLVPRRAGAVEVHHLAGADQALLWREVSRIAALMERLFNPDKMNIAALGNMVRQLHVHVIARFTSDPCWPRPVWIGHGGVAPRPYEKSDLATLLLRLQQGMDAMPETSSMP
jgi:diadenosine tetraphosphate (Ap4A) HIT family hydrolase